MTPFRWNISRLLILIVVAAAVLLVARREPLPPGEGGDPAVGRPILQFTESSHDFGTLVGDTTVHYTFEFRNAGDSPLVIDRVKASCGCTGAVVGKAQIAPGESGELNVYFRTKGKNGVQRHAVHVFSNDPVHPDQPLMIHCVVEHDFVFRPSAVFFGSMTAGEERTNLINISSNDPELRIERIEPSSDRITFSLKDGPRQDGPGRQWNLNVSIRAPEKPGMTHDVLTVLTNSQTMAEIKVRLQARVLGDISLLSEHLAFPSVKTGQTVSQTTRLTSHTGKKITVRRIDTGALPLKVEVEDQGDDPGKKLKLVFTAPDRPDTVRGTVTLDVSDSSGYSDTLKLYVMANVR